MKLTYLATLAYLFTAINAVPEPQVETVFITVYHTVVVDKHGHTLTLTSSTTETADATVDPTTLTTEYLPSTSTTPSSPTTSTKPSGSLQSGEGTYYSVELGACGKVNSDDEYVIAVSHGLYDDHNIDNNPNHNPLCGKKIRAYYEGKSVDVTIVDRCASCAYNDLDFSPSAFTQLADKKLGRIDITWEWL